MTCEIAQQNIVLAHYGELPDEYQFTLEQHLTNCEGCRREWNAMLALQEDLGALPMVEPSPNFLAAARMRLDEALDELPPRSVGQRLLGNAFRWMGFLKGAPALTTLLIGSGFLGGNFVARYQELHAAKLPPAVILSSPTDGAIASVSGIVQTPVQGVVQVKYNRIVPEMVQGSLDDPQIRQLLMLGTRLATNNDVHATSVSLMADECRNTHSCVSNSESTNASLLRSALLSELHYDKSAEVRLKALNGLQPYVGEDQQVRDALLDALVRDKSADVRSQAISMLSPVQGDSSVRQVLRKVSSEDENPAIRNASFQMMQGSATIE
jgi:hypothetical protein